MSIDIKKFFKKTQKNFKKIFLKNFKKKKKIKKTINNSLIFFMCEHKMKVQSITHFNVVFQAYKAFLLFNRHIIGVIIKTPDTRFI